MAKSKFLDINGIAEILELSVNSVRNYERMIKQEDEKAYEKLFVWDKKYKKGRGKKLYLRKEFSEKVQEARTTLIKEREAKRQASISKSKNPRGRKRKKPQVNKMDTVHEEAIEAEVVNEIGTTENLPTLRLGNFKIDSQEAIRIVRVVSDMFLTGKYSVDKACEVAGIRSAQFWKIVAHSEETADLWEKAVAQRVTQNAVETEFWIMKRLMDRLKTTKIKKEKIDYKYMPRINSEGEVERVPIEVSKVEITEDFIPSASDIIALRKMALEIHLDAKKRTGGNTTEQYASEKSEEQLRQEIEEYDRMIKELEQKAKEQGSNTTME